jgi:hypothetical protein
MDYEVEPTEEDETFGVRFRGPWTVPPEVFQEVIEGRVTQRDFVVYAGIGHLIWIDYEFISWADIAKLLKMDEPRLMLALKRLTDAGWLYWDDWEARKGCNLRTSKRVEAVA